MKVWLLGIAIATKTRLQHILTAAAINLERIYAWLEEIPLAKTRISHFEREGRWGFASLSNRVVEKMANQRLAIAWREIFEFANSIRISAQRL